MFRAERPRIRDVDVEVVTSGGDRVVEPEIHEPPIEAPNNGADRRSLRTLLWRRDAAEAELDGVQALNGNAEAVLDVDAQVDAPDAAVAPSAELPEVAPADEIPDETIAEAVEPAPEPVEELPVEEGRPPEVAAQDPPPPLPQTPKTRVVWSSAPTAKTKPTHTLKVTKPAPSPSVRVTPATPQKAAPKPAEAPKTAKPPAPPHREPPPVVETPAEGVSPAPEPVAREQTCDILFWRGYRKAAFYGRTFDETGEAVAIAESPFFRPQGNGAPEPTEAARTAYDALRSQLIAAGWEPVSAGDEWFDETFRLTAAPEPAPE